AELPHRTPDDPATLPSEPGRKKVETVRHADDLLYLELRPAIGDVTDDAPHAPAAAVEHDHRLEHCVASRLLPQFHPGIQGKLPRRGVQYALGSFARRF